jgi:NTE family protein
MKPVTNVQKERALVLGGGGSLGNAWELGVSAGLLEAGLDITKADLIIGTSAGSTAAAQISCASPAKLYADILAAEFPQRPPRTSGTAVVDHLARTGAIIAAASDPGDMRRKLGAAALALDGASDGTRQARWRDIVAARLPSQQWPHQSLQVIVVDAATGEPVVFDRHSGVHLADAIAASTSSGAPYTIGNSRYIDGGYRRNENADLAAGYARVLVLSPFSGRSRHPVEWGMHLQAQVDELQASGSRVETIFPDDSSLQAFGENMMDVSRYQRAARVGYDQGRALSQPLAEFWV